MTFWMGVVAAVCVVQAVCLFLAMRDLGRIARAVDQTTLRLREEVLPVLRDLDRASRNLAETSGRVAGQARRVDGLLGRAAEAWGAVRVVLDDVAEPAVTSLVGVSAVVRLLSRVVGIWRRSRSRTTGPRVAAAGPATGRRARAGR
jgi:ABC-type transporter Mla subunit MlaD